MDERTEESGLAISAIGHLVLLVGLVLAWFFAVPTTMSTSAIGVDMISDAELTQIVAGVKTGEKTATPKPIVDKIGEQSPPVKDPTPKVSDKPEIQPSAAEAAPPPEPKSEPAKAEPKPEPKVDEIAEALKREEAKKREEQKKLAEAKKREDAKKREEARKREEAKKREQEKFDTGSIENRLALIDKRAPQRHAATGASLNQVAALGGDVPTGPSLSASEMDALSQRLADCWDVPIGVRNARDLVVIVRIQFKPDGSLSAEPVVVNHSTQPIFQVAADAAIRAVHKGAPFRFMPRAKYEAWKEVEVKFDPKEMFGL